MHYGVEPNADALARASAVSGDRMVEAIMAIFATMRELL